MPEPELRPARPEESDAIAGLLSAAGLPVEDLSVAMLDAFVVAADSEVCVGVVGLEVYESNALLRSLAVEQRHRSRGLGTRLIDAIETEAKARGVTAVYLLTTTATTFFERLGYTTHDRAAVPPSIAATTEFSSLCPDTADCLWRDLSIRSRQTEHGSGEFNRPTAHAVAPRAHPPPPSASTDRCRTG